MFCNIYNVDSFHGNVVSLPGHSWAFLGLPGPSWVFLGFPGASWVFLGLPGPSWAFLGLPGRSGVSWGSLGLSTPSWVFLGLPVPSWAFLGLLFEFATYVAILLGCLEAATSSQRMPMLLESKTDKKHYTATNCHATLSRCNASTHR